MGTRIQSEFNHAVRIISIGDTARRFGRSTRWLKRRLPRLCACGFPSFDALTKGFDAVAVDRWFDLRAGLESDPTENTFDILKIRAEKIANE